MADSRKKKKSTKAKQKKRRTRRQAQRARILVAVVIIIAVAIAIIIAVRVAAKHRQGSGGAAATVQREKYIADEPELDVELLPINPYSRPGTSLDEVNGIVIHYTANPGTTALQNRNYFANLAETQETSASSHFIIGLEGEIVQCIPCSEIAYASGGRNSDTISIECCIEDDTGRFNSKTYDSLIKLTTWLMGRYGLDTNDVIRHYDVSGKNCPKYYVENPGAWALFKTDLEDYIEKYGIYREDES